MDMDTRVLAGLRRFVALCVIALAAGACADRPAAKATKLLPAQLHGLQLVETQTAEEAAGIVGRLHKQDLTARETEIGIYGSDGLRAELYVSAFETADEAAAQFESMLAAIGEGVPGYGHHTHFDVSGLDVHSVFGNGRINYFYAKGEQVTWLGAEPMIARAIIAELLAVQTDSIPELPGMPRAREEGERS